MERPRSDCEPINTVLLSFPREAEPAHPRASSSTADCVPVAQGGSSIFRDSGSGVSRRSPIIDSRRCAVRLLSTESLLVAGVLPLSPFGFGVRGPFDLCHARPVAAEQRRHLSPTVPTLPDPPIRRSTVTCIPKRGCSSTNGRLTAPAPDFRLTITSLQRARRFIRS